MIKYHGRSFDIEDLGDFFSVGPGQETENLVDNQNACEVSLLIFSTWYITQRRPVPHWKNKQTSTTKQTPVVISWKFHH